MTYLNLVNNVLKRLREAEVTTVEGFSGGSSVSGATDYGKLIGMFVNDAIRIVEDSWDWGALRVTTSKNTVADSSELTLTGLRQNSSKLDGINDTSNVRLKNVSKQWFNDKTLLSDVITGSPEYFMYDGVHTDGSVKIKVYPTPDAVYALKFDFVDRSDTLSNDTSTIAVPSLPVIQYAVALASRERGETGGMSSAELYAQADATLADAIALDAARHPTETIWYTA
jgi:hypothetical protein